EDRVVRARRRGEHERNREGYENAGAAKTGGIHVDSFRATAAGSTVRRRPPKRLPDGDASAVPAGFLGRHGLPDSLQPTRIQGWPVAPGSPRSRASSWVATQKCAAPSKRSTRSGRERRRCFWKGNRESERPRSGARPSNGLG